MCLPMKVSWETNVSVTEYKKSCIYRDPCTSTVSELYDQNNKPFDVWKKKISTCFGKHIPDFRHENDVTSVLKPWPMRGIYSMKLE